MKWYQKLWAVIKRKWWYLVLLICSSVYVWHYRLDLYELSPLNSQNLIFVLWIILLVSPLFSEIELLGVKLLKKELEKTTKEVKSDINDLKLQLLDFKVTNSVAQTFYMGNPLLPQSELAELSIEAEKVSQNSEFLRRSDINVDDNVTEDSVYLFKVRVGIENKLAELCSKTGYDGRRAVMQMVQHVYRCELIEKVTLDLIMQIIQIANRGVHGEIVSREYVDFVKKNYSHVQSQLSDALDRLHPIACPRCHYVGYAKCGNACPKCGFISDDE